MKYMRIPSTAGTRDPERSRFFHKPSLDEAGKRHIGTESTPVQMREVRR